MASRHQEEEPILSDDLNRIITEVRAGRPAIGGAPNFLEAVTEQLFQVVTRQSLAALLKMKNLPALPKDMTPPTSNMERIPDFDCVRRRIMGCVKKIPNGARVIYNARSGSEDTHMGRVVACTTYLKRVGKILAGIAASSFASGYRSNEFEDYDEVQQFIQHTLSECKLILSEHKTEIIVTIIGEISGIEDQRAIKTLENDCMILLSMYDQFDILMQFIMARKEEL